MKRSLFFIWVFFFSIQCFATHIRGGEITIKRTSGYSCRIILKGFVHVSPVKFGGGIIDFGDGSPTLTTPSENYSPTTDPLVWTYLFAIDHTYPGPGFYNVTYFEQNLDAGIINMANSVDTPFFIETGFLIDPFVYLTPITFAADPIFDFTTGRPFSFSTAPTDTLSYIYNYGLVVPNQASGITVSDYVFPETLQVNSQTGLITWDTKFRQEYLPGEYLFAVRVNQYDLKKNYLGYVIRTFSVNLQGAVSKFFISNPITDPEGKVKVLPGNKRTIKLILTDTISTDTVFWNPYFDPALVNNVTFSQYDSTIAAKKIKVGLLTLTSTSGIAKELPYQITLRGISFEQDALLAKDISILFFTRDVELPIVTAVAPSDEKISVYPNPCINELHFSGANNGSVEVTNNLGQLLIQSAVGPDESIDTSTLSPGIYFLILSENSRRYRFKVVKK